jgi:serine/threonine protein phosphatase 1
MLKLFGSRRTPRGYPATEQGERVYAIGDVHGRLDLLRDLLRRIDDHSAGLPPAESTHIILLGDLIDRGTQSREVLNFVYSIQQRTDGIVTLLGNHEELMLKAIDKVPGTLDAWMRMGGRATVRSFGLEPPAAGESARDYADRLRAAVPPELLEWMRTLPLTASSGSYMFCHAGIRPGVSLKRQSRTDLLWIRKEFLEDDSSHGVVVVHGHSIAADVEMRSNRIGIDTGAYRTGVLTALYLEGAEREIIATPPVEQAAATA